MRRHPRQGFTLTELLVVAAVISLLVAIVAPVFTRAKEIARRTICMCNLRHVGYATHLYIEEHEFHFPDMIYSFSPGKSGTIVVLVVPKKAACSGLSNYQPKGILLCPSDSNPGEVPVRMEDDSIVGLPVSYGYNIDFLVRDIRYDQIAMYDRLAVFFDGSMGMGGGKKQGHYAGSFDFAEESLVQRHLGQANVVFADWHVETVSDLTEENILDGHDPIGNGNGQSGGKGNGRRKK